MPQAPMLQGAERSERLQILVLERVDRARRMARYYVLAIEASLFGDISLSREWGRCGAAPRRRIELYPDANAAGVELDKWLLRKSRRGYRERA